MPFVPNQFPKLAHPTFRLAIIGDSPSREDGVMGTPFIGADGQLLRRVLGANNLSADQCYLGNIIQDSSLDDSTASPDTIASGLQTLSNDLFKFRPNCTLLLGQLPFRTFYSNRYETADRDAPSRSLSNYRGSILLSSASQLLPEAHRKVVPTYHPTEIQRVYSDIPYFQWDIGRAVRQSGFAELNALQRAIIIRPTLAQVQQYILEIRALKLEAGFDVEGWNDNVGITCFSIAKSPTDCMVIPLVLNHGKNYWSLDEEVEIWRITAGWLTDPACGKRVTNAAYEQFILAWKHNICIVNITEDTMLKQWECFPELEKSLAIQTSIWTEEPYYKHERLAESDDGQLLYNGKDSCVTTEISDAQEKALSKLPLSYAHYRFNMAILPAMQYLMLRGVKFDHKRAQQHIAETEVHLSLVQRDLDLALVQPAMDADILTRKRKSDPWTFNVKSNTQKQWLLYTYLNYKPYRKFGQDQITANEETLLRYYSKTREPLLKTLIRAVQLRTRISDVNKLTPNSDGRLRCNYNVVGTDTGRLSSSSSNALEATFSKTGKLTWEESGTNMQNVTNELRDCAIPDSDDYYFWNCDLSGADGWTVAADLAALGNPTMLDDYRAGIKPAKVLLLMLDEQEAGRDPATINQLPREEILKRTKALTFPDERDAEGRPGDWKYLCMKRVQHGSNYDMQPDKLAETIFKDSDGLIDLTPRQAGMYQYLYKLRYNPKARIDWITRQLSETGCLQTASGIRRKFFNIRSRNPDPNVVRAALAFEPQANTTYATNAALLNLWNDPLNRTSRGSLFIEPLIQIHDALSGQFKKKHAAFAVERIRSYFNTPLVIHGINITIPFEGGYGSNWRDCKGNKFH